MDVMEEGNEAASPELIIMLIRLSTVSAHMGI